MRGEVLVGAFTALLISACAVGPDYRRPDIHAPEVFQYEPDNAAATSDTQWWRQFGDPVLDDLISEALANNTDVRIATANVQKAASILMQTRSAFYPQVGYGIAGGKSGGAGSSELSDLPVFPGSEESYQALLSASWEIDLWGRIRRLSESARASLLATGEARRGVILSLVATVANSYLELRALDEQLTVANATLETYRESVRLFELQFQYGQVSMMTVAQSQSQYQVAAAQIPQIEAQIAQTQNALSVLVGRNPGPVVRGKPIGELLQPEVPAGVPSSLLERRPDLLQAEQQLIAANAQIGAAKARYFPAISLTGALGRVSPDLSDLFSGSESLWTYKGSVTGPIFAGGVIRGGVAEARAVTEAALLNYELSIRNAFADVDNALVANLKLQQQLVAQTNLVNALREYSQLARLQYDEGYTAYTTVLQAEQSLFPAELELAAVRASVLGSAVNIYRAMGGGWVTEADQMTVSETKSVESK